MRSDMLDVRLISVKFLAGLATVLFKGSNTVVGCYDSIDNWAEVRFV